MRARGILSLTGLALAAGQLLSGCGGSSQIAPSVLNKPSSFEPGSTDQQSWMNPKAKQGALLYVSETPKNRVLVYSYPDPQLKGTLARIYA
jgi:hypothetical protein